MDVLGAGEEIAGYRIESLLGRGGMAVVYRAEDTRLGRHVALKLLSPELMENEQFRLRFIRESKLAASLDHPNIIPIYEAGEAGGLLYLAMRLVIGSDLKAVIGGRPLDAERVLHLATQVCNALDAAHAQGLVHRDVKPGNILVSPTADGTDHVYLTDFGLTKRTTSLSGALTRTGNFLGTIDYVAPEQIAAKPVDSRTDVYALGCVLYECFTGTLPFHRDDDAAMLWAHLMDAAPKVTALRPELGVEVDAVVGRAMAKAPEDRYASCHGLLLDLRAAMGVPVTVPGSGPAGGGSPGFAGPGTAAPAVPGQGAPAGAGGAGMPPGTQHPSFPPGVFDPTSGQAAVPGSAQPEGGGAQQPDDEADWQPAWEQQPGDQVAAGPVLDDGYTDDAYVDGEYADGQYADGDYAAPPAGGGARGTGRRQPWLVPVLAGALVLALGATLWLLFLRPSSTDLSHQYEKSQLVPFSFQYPGSWQARSESINLVVSADPDSMGPLFLGGGSGDWSGAQRLLASNASDAVGMFTTFSNSLADPAKPEDLKTLLPQGVDFPGRVQNASIGGLPGKVYKGTLTDPSSGDQLGIVTYAVTVQSPQPALVVLTFFSAPSQLADNTALFEQMLGTVDFG